MPDSYADLHCHSTASDGTYAPAEVVRLARAAGLSALALTDHDTVGGIAEAAAEASRLGIDFLAGIEISCEYRGISGIMHILGYGVDASSPHLKSLTSDLVDARGARNPRIIARLNELGVRVSMAEWEARAAGGVMGRPQLAAILMEKGYVSSIQQAFDKFLGQDGLAYFDKERLSPKDALGRIALAGGTSVLAHPVQLRITDDRQLEAIVEELVDLGLGGIEVMHSDHDAEMVRKYGLLAEGHGLLKTGGSDFHGRNKEGIGLGWAAGQRIPRRYFDDLVGAREVRTADHPRQDRSAVRTLPEAKP